MTPGKRIDAVAGAGTTHFRLIRRLREDLEANITGGASNVGFGLPPRRIERGLPFRGHRHRQVKAADWETPGDVKRDVRSASILEEGRVAINTAASKYHIDV